MYLQSQFSLFQNITRLAMDAIGKSLERRENDGDETSNLEEILVSPFPPRPIPAILTRATRHCCRIHHYPSDVTYPSNECIIFASHPVQFRSNKRYIISISTVRTQYCQPASIPVSQSVHPNKLTPSPSIPPVWIRNVQHWFLRQSMAYPYTLGLLGTTAVGGGDGCGGGEEGGGERRGRSSEVRLDL